MRGQAAAQRRVACAAALFVLGGSIVVAAAARQTAPSAQLQLPDILQLAPYDLTGASVRTPSGTRFKLGFASAVVNVGVGPLEIEGSRPSRATPTMTAKQIVRRADGTGANYAKVGQLRFVVSQTHRHWHLLAFEQYELRRAVDGKVVRRDAKTGFCLGDRYNAYRNRPLAKQPKRSVYTRLCEKNHLGVLRVREGISVGYGDAYKPQIEGQYLDVTGLPAGVYELLHRVNVDRRLREASYANDAASILIRLSWSRGPQQPPTVDVLARCGDGRRCRQR